MNNLDEMLIEVDEAIKKFSLNNKDLQGKLMRAVELFKEKEAECNQSTTKLEMILCEKRISELELGQLKVGVNLLKMNSRSIFGERENNIKKE